MENINSVGEIMYCDKVIDDCDSDSDILPSFEDIRSGVAYSLPIESSTSYSSSCNSSPLSRPPPAPPRDLNVKLPVGMIVLAYDISNRSFHPAKILESRITLNGKLTYKLFFWDQITKVVSSRIVPFEDVDFSTTKLSSVFIEAITNGTVSYDIQQFTESIESIFPELVDIYLGNDSSCERYTKFIKGGKYRQSLLSIIGRGSFLKVQSDFLMDYLQRSLTAIKDFVESAQLISLVIYPEAIVRLLQYNNSISREQAEKDMTTTVHWMEQVFMEYQLHIQRVNKANS